MSAVLKNKLLATGYFKDNEYLDSYIELVTTKAVTPSVFKTQSHHILPKTYFKTTKLTVDNTQENLVELLFRDHVLAHWFLSKCTIQFLYRNSCYAVRYMLSRFNLNKYKIGLSDADLSLFQQLYEASIISINKTDFINYYSTHSCKETAQQFSISLNTVTRLATEYDCLKCLKRHTAKQRTIISKFDLYNYYIEQNHSLADTANYFGVDKSTIIRRLKDCGLHQTKNKYRHSLRLDYAKTPDDLTSFLSYCRQHSIANTASVYNMSVANVKLILKQNNIKKAKEFNWQDVFEYYKINGCVKTMNHFNISKSHLYRIVKTFNV